MEWQLSKRTEKTKINALEIVNHEDKYARRWENSESKK